MQKRGEITVFLSLVLVCVMSLFMGLLESARTAGARLYLQMAADSSMASVMSHYNRNLWDMYHLLFLEYESEEAIEQSFSEYLEFYLAQENLYPMKVKDICVTETEIMTEDGGAALEQEILSYMKYRLPDVAADFAGILKETSEAENAGDFRHLFEVCRKAGKRTRKLEKERIAIEESLSEMEKSFGKIVSAAESRKKGSFESNAEQLLRKIGQFPGLVDSYEAEIQNVSEHCAELESEQMGNMNLDAAQNLQQELTAYRQVEIAANEQLRQYREMENILETAANKIENALNIFEETKDMEEEVYITENGMVEIIEEGGPDWDMILSYLNHVEIPGETANETADKEAMEAIDRLEELFQGNLLALVLPEDETVSEKTISVSGLPSKVRGSESVKAEDGSDRENKNENGYEYESGLLDRYLINEYCFLSFDSFLETCTRSLTPKEQALKYEQEYLLCGEVSDRENLAETVEKLLAIRGAMNMLFLLSSADRKLEADNLAIAVSGGNLPVQFVLSFFILTLWAFGEAVWDVKCLLNGGKVPFWKSQRQWKFSLEEILSLQFLEPASDNEAAGNDYEDYMRVLFFLMDEEERNFRIMDVIQWNVQTYQDDFSVSDCAGKVIIQAEVYEKHLFLIREEYTRTVRANGSY